MNTRDIVSRSDLCFTRCVNHDEGLPVGNGRVGGLLWCIGAEIHLQVNHTDVFPFDRATESMRNIFDDYCGGCGAIEFRLDHLKFYSTFEHALHNVQARLTLYEGLAELRGDGVTVRTVADPEQDVIAFEFNGPAEAFGHVEILLHSLRPTLVQANRHTARSTLHFPEGQMALCQTFEEKDHYCATALAVAVLGRAAMSEAVRGAYGQMRLAADGEAAFTVLVAAATSMDRTVDVLAQARQQLDRAAATEFAGIRQRAAAWWADFWSKSVIHLHSADGVADELERGYTTWLYHMGCCSRGRYPVKFNGMLWTCNGDERSWGSQYWWWNTETLHRALNAANHGELMAPLFRLYSSLCDSCALAARQQWGSEGLFFPETVPFNGMEPLPDAIAQELKAFLLGEKTWAESSLAFRRLAESRHRLSSRWNFLKHNRVNYHLPYSYVVHVFSSGAKIACYCWRHYEYTGDRAFLREQAYPLLKGVAEFYRHLPLVRKDSAGIYHIYGVNNHESFWGGTDTMEELAAMRGAPLLAAAAADILGVDPDLRVAWRDFAAHVAPYPTSADPDALGYARHPDGPTWAAGRKPVAFENDHHVFDTVRPCVHYDLWTLESDDAATAAIAQRTFDLNAVRKGCARGERPHILAETAIEAACLGRAADVQTILPLQVVRPANLANRTTPEDGVQTQTVEHLGQAACALQQALCQSIAPAPGAPPAIRLFPAWPSAWDASFTLLCRGGFLVHASIARGVVGPVEILAQRGGICRLRTPWPGRAVRLTRDGQPVGTSRVDLLVLETQAGERIRLEPD